MQHCEKKQISENNTQKPKQPKSRRKTPAMVTLLMTIFHINLSWGVALDQQGWSVLFMHDTVSTI